MPTAPDQQDRTRSAGDPLKRAGRDAGDAALLAEAAPAEDWLRPEEDATWAHLQPANEDVAREVEPASSTEAQRHELERRLADSIDRPDAVTPWEEVLDVVQRKQGGRQAVT